VQLFIKAFHKAIFPNRAHMRLLYSTDHGWETINWAILILEKKNKKSFHFFDIISSIGSEIKKK
jgi:hypothetical protein